MYLNSNKSTNLYYFMCLFVHGMAWKIGKSASANILSLDIPQLHHWQWANKSTKLYNYNFTENTVSFDCVLEDLENQFQGEMYKLTFFLDELQVRYSKGYFAKDRKIRLRSEMKLNKESKIITCTAEPVDGRKKSAFLTNVIKLHYVPPTLSSNLRMVKPVLSLSISQLDQWQWQNRNCTKMYNYNFTDSTEVSFDCVLENKGSRDEIYLITFYVDEEIVKRFDNVKVSGYTTRSMKLETWKLNKENNNITCTAVPKKGTKDAPMLKNVIKLHYVPAALYTSTNTTPKTSDFNIKRSWLTWTLVACAVLIVCFAAGCAVYCRKKKPSPVEPTYANLSKDDNYQCVPLPNQRTEKLNNEEKQKVSGDTYSEIQDSENLSKNQLSTEAPYAEPYNSITYAEPYVASTYAEPCSPNGSDLQAPKDSNAPSDLYVPDAPYATPIPKARRINKAKDDNKSNTEYMASSNDTYADLHAPTNQYISKDSTAPKDLCSSIDSIAKEPYTPDAPYATPIPKARRMTRVEDYGYKSDAYSDLYAPKNPSAPMDPTAPVDSYAPEDLHTPSKLYASEEPHAIPIPKPRRK